MGIKCPKCDFENPTDTLFCGKCGTQFPSPEKAEVTETLETPREELTRGTTLANRYEIIEELGKGGMGRVYRVEDTKLKQEVALKLIKPEIAKDKKTIERFRNELKTARMIAHKNVCRMFDLGEAEGAHFITMEYVSGQDLRGLIRQSGQLAVGTTINIAKQVCEGLIEAHKLGVVHRDLKPSNVMIDKDGNARIMDFGIARSLEAKGITGAGIMIGTPEYMSPEQVEGKEVDQLSDIYSLGVILYEMVTGQVPFEGDTPFTIGVKHKSAMPKDPKELNNQIPENLNSFIMRCLEKEKEKRFQSADEVRSELESIEKGIPTKERVAPERKPFTSKEITVQFSVKKLFIPALIFIAVVIIGLTLWQILPREKAFPGFPSDKPSIAVVYFMNQTGDEALDHWREALPRWIITDLSQSKYINVLSADRLFSILRKLNLLEIKNYASEDLKNVANEGRVNHIFQASFSKAGDIFRIDYSLQKGDTLEIIDSDYVTGGNEESFPSLVDNITKKIRVELELSEEQVINDIDREVGTITTNFPEAFKYYSIGEKFKNIAEMEKCIKLMEQAVAIDPEFAMAYRAMAISYSNLGYRTKAIEILQKALSLTDRLSDRERYRIEADFYSRSEKTYDKAFEAYEKLLEIYPDETGARQNLAIRYGVIGEIHKAIEHYEILIREYQTDFYGTYTNLASRYIDLGLYDKAKETLEKFKNNVKDSPIIHGAFAYYYLYQGKYDLALEEIEKTFALDPTDWRIHKGRGDAYYFMGDLEKAEEEYRKLLENEEPVAKRSGILDLGFLFTIKGRYKESIEMEKRMLKQSEELGEKTWIRGAKSALSYMELRSGNPKRALELIEENLESAVEDEHLGDQREALYRKALIFVEMDQLAEAQKAAQELKALIENGMIKNQMWRYYNLMGKIEIERKDFSKAIEYLKKGLPLLFPTSELQMIYADSLGLAYYNSGDFEKAQEEYEKIDLSRGMIDYADIYAKAFYMLGKIHEEKGDKAKAVEHYEKFFDLWKDADPGIAEFGDARKRLAGLKSH